MNLLSTTITLAGGGHSPRRASFGDHCGVHPSWRVGLVAECGGRGRSGAGDLAVARAAGSKLSPSAEGGQTRRFDRARNSENARTKPMRIGWQEIRNLFCILRFDQKHRTNWHLTTWPDWRERSQTRPPGPRDHGEGGSVVETGARALVDQESVTLRASRCFGRG